jgi:restriction endonuclease S subunit
MHMQTTLKELVEMRAGHPFRSRVRAYEKGLARVIQLRDVSADGSVAWASLVRTDMRAHKSPEWLRAKDVLFAGRGGRAYALCLDEVPAYTVCAQYFFVLRCRPDIPVMPQYLAWHINRAPSQRYLLSNAEGSGQLNIRRGVLEELPIAVPELACQSLVVDLARAAAKECRHLKALIRNREQQFDALAQHLLVPAHRPQ